MTNDNDLPPEPTIFSAVLTPHRSLSRQGFIAVMAAFGLASFATGMVFLAMGAWPVLGFFGLDVLLVYWAFRANYRSAAAREEVIVTPSLLTVRKVASNGATQHWTVNPLWVRIETETDPDFGVTKLALVSRGQELPIADCLGAGEKQSFAAALTLAIQAAKRGVARTVLP